jgi:hypothetical protein
MMDVIEDFDSMRPRAGVLNRRHLDDLAEILVGDVNMIVRFSPANASSLAPDKYQLYESRYSEIRVPRRPWTDPRFPEPSRELTES